MSVDHEISAIERLELLFAPETWEFAVVRRQEIEAHFAAIQKANPAIFNGRVLLMHHHRISGKVFHGWFFETDYASFTAWKSWARPDPRVFGCFGAAAVISKDGAFLLGEMGAHTANAGQIYFPCGTPDPDDVMDGRVDLDHSVRRELKEETGLDVAECEREPGWTMVRMPGQFALIQVLRSHQRAADLRTRVLAHLSSERQPELADIRLVHAPSELDDATSVFVRSFVSHRWTRPEKS